jgi:ATP-dependent exoDNAse (exonuclease V) beta subunit
MTALASLDEAAEADEMPERRGGVPFTGDQRAAIADRAGSALLVANAGSGKTAVMVERFVEAVLEDGVAVGSILALTFTEKAAGELRERVRRRFTALGEIEAAREAEAAWIGTIHGFCARVLRARPLAAGLDPRFTVLDAAAARRLAERAYDVALDAWAAAHGARAVDLAAAYGPGLRDMIAGTYEALRSRGQSRPRLPGSPAAAAAGVAGAAGAADVAGGAEIAAAREALLAARDAAAAGLAVAGAGKKVSAARDALDALVLPGDGSLPWPGTLDPARLPGGAKALDEPACIAYREAWEAYRSACADHHAREALVLLDDLLDRFGAEYEAAKAARAGVDFSDLELRVRDLLADDGARRSWAERFALIMIDEFQDTNRLQLDVLEALERDNLFAVGDELQSIYGFRHADVNIFRERRARLPAASVRRLTHNFRSAAPLLDVLNGAFASELGPAFTPLVAGRPRSRSAAASADDVPLRLFDPDGEAPAAGEPLVELLLTDTRGWDEPELERELGLAGGGSQPWRRAEARLVAHRLRAEVDGGRRPGDVVVLVRATGSLRLLEQALEEQGLPTYVVGGRGYWSQEQVRDGIAYLSVLANPQDEEALLAVLASPFCGVRTDALVLLAQAGRESGLGAWAALRDEVERSGGPGDGPVSRDAAVGGGPSDGAASGRADAGGWLRHLPEAERDRLREFVRFLAAERSRAERTPAETLLERAVAMTGYDLAVLARSGGDRRLANLRKLMRLARDYERAEGADLRGLVDYAMTQDLAEAREGEAALESDGLDAVRLMTIHRAKGLEFPVVCVADLGRGAITVRDRLLVGDGGAVGLRLAPIGGGDAIPALAWDALAEEERRAEDEEERRLFYVAMTRARERLILSGGVDRERLPDPRPAGPPIDWIWRALGADVAEPETVVERAGARLLCRVNAPATIGTVLPHAALSPAARPRAGAPGTALPDAPAVLPEPPPRARPAPQRLSYSALGAYARCGYRFYLERVLGLPRVAPPPPDEIAQADAIAGVGADGIAQVDDVAGAGADLVAEADAVAGVEEAVGGLDPRVRGSLVHRLLEDLDYARPAPPAVEAVAELAAEWGLEPTAAELEDVRGLVAAFARSPLCARLASARRTRKEAPFSFTLDAAGGGPLVTGFIDVVAHEPDGGALVVDYKSDRLEGAAPADVVERDYATQRLVYALAALRDGAPSAEVAYCFLERPDEPVTATFTDASVLTEELAGLAADLLDGRFPVTDAPHRELCGDCPGRAAMCSWPETATLAADPPPR